MTGSWNKKAFLTCFCFSRSSISVVDLQFQLRLLELSLNLCGGRALNPLASRTWLTSGDMGHGDVSIIFKTPCVADEVCVVPPLMWRTIVIMLSQRLVRQRRDVVGGATTRDPIFRIAWCLKCATEPFIVWVHWPNIKKANGIRCERSFRSKTFNPLTSEL